MRMLEKKWASSGQGKTGLAGQRDFWYRSGAYERCYHRGIFRHVWNYVYRKMEQPFGQVGSALSVVEMGAGAGNHRPFVRHSVSSYLEVDQLDYSDAPNPYGVDRVVGNVEKLPLLETHSCDRVVATCVLAHLDDPRSALAEWNRIVKPGGRLTIYVPPEGGLLTDLLRRGFIWPKQRRLGLSESRLIAAIEHRYTFEFLRAIILEEFGSAPEVSERRFPWGLPHHLAAFTVFQISK